MRLMILEHRRLRHTLRASEGTVTIGSNPECGVHLPDPRIGAHQADITQDPQGAWWLEVMDTSVHTSLNRAVQKGRAKLRHADEIGVGDFTIRLFMESDKTREELRHERMQALDKKHVQGLPLGTIIHKLEDQMAISKEHLEQMILLALRLEKIETVRDLMTPLLRATLRTFEARRAWIGLRRSGKGDFEWTLGISQDGQPCDRPSYTQQMQSRCLSHTQYLCVPEVPLSAVGSAMAVPLPCQSGNLGMLYLENDRSDKPYDEASLNGLNAMACCVALPLEDVMHRQTAKREAAVGTELTIARATQDAVTLKAFPEWEELQVAAYRRPGSTHCCDFYDVMQLRDRTASLIVARIVVPNAAAPRYLAELRAAFRAASLYSEPPHLFARALNWIVYDGDARHAIDLACVSVAPSSGKVLLCRAGTGIHLGRIHADGTCERIEPPAMPAIGASRAPTYASHTFDLAAGDTLVLASEGISTAANAKGEAFGLTGLEENLCDGLGDTPGHVLAELAADLDEFLTDGDCADDLTVLLLQRQ